MRALFGCGTPREAAGASQAFLLVVQTQSVLLLAFVAEAAGETGALLMCSATIWMGGSGDQDGFCDHAWLR